MNTEKKGKKIDAKNDGEACSESIEKDFSDDPENNENYCLLPSEVTDRKYVFYPPEFEAAEDEKDETGKWLIFAFGELDRIDFRWMILRPLVEEGVLIAIKSSTASDTEKGVTMCYTVDADDKNDVKNAADEIRKLVDYGHIMYYKTCESSRQGQYIHEGSKNIGRYMHTFRGGFYERDNYGRWKCISVSSLEKNAI